MFCLYTLPLARPAQAKIQMLTTCWRVIRSNLLPLIKFSRLGKIILICKNLIFKSKINFLFKVCHQIPTKELLQDELDFQQKKYLVLILLPIIQHAQQMKKSQQHQPQGNLLMGIDNKNIRRQVFRRLHAPFVYISSLLSSTLFIRKHNGAKLHFFFETIRC